ncbi:MAG: CoA transferase [Gammaproteobacteria bacterium]|nr:CoA transferase [Gammaproteobacteria bacterium]
MKLEGVRVLDLSLFLPGPVMTQMMADHGAEVIKLEPLAGEPNREIGPKRDGLTVYFANTHRNKRSIQLNLKTAAGRAAALDLAATCDVVVEAFRPGVIERLGLGYEAVRARNPGVVYCSMSAWGQDGPYVQVPAHDLACEAVAGVLSLNRGADGSPAIPGIAGADMLSSMMTLSAILMALLRRKDTGAGDYVDVAMADSLIAALANNMGTTFADKTPPDLAYERALGGYAMYNIYPTKGGGHLVLGGSEIHFAEAILERLGRPDLLELCQPPPGPRQEPVKDFLRETFLTRTRDEWMEFFRGINASVAPLNDLREAVDDPQLRHRQMIVEDERGWEHIGTPLKFRHEPGELKFTFAQPGEHTETVLRELGYDAAAIAAMKAEGAF